MSLATYNDIVFYDIEVFLYYWCIVYNEYNSDDYIVIDDLKTALEFYKYISTSDKILVGYNSRGYDLPVLKAILGGLNPYLVSSAIIKNHAKISSVVPKNIQSKFKINNYDAYDNQHSLKQLEGFMGMDIRETEVDFDLDRNLTSEEIKRTHFYCKHDVLALKEYFKIREKQLGSFESHAILIDEYNLPREYFNKTGVQLTSIILGAVQQHTMSDEFNYSIPNTLNLSEKNKDILEFYEKPENKCYRKIFATDKNSSGNWKKEFVKNICGIDCTFGFGGFHGSIDNLIYDGGNILVADVSSEYPNFMINYNSISRKVKEPDKYNSVVQRRLKLKAIGDAKNKAFKPVINGTFGATKDRNNTMYDPRIANQITVGCQLLMSDLLEKIGIYGKPINANTDGIYIIPKDNQSKEKIIELAHEWENRTGLTLEFETYDKIIQANVNNYILIKKNSDGKIKYKAKGGFFKEKTLIDNDLPIVTEAIINYFVYDIPIEKTINDCDELIKFQKIIKLTEKYHKVVVGKTKSIPKKNGFAQVIDTGEVLEGKVHRVFASNNPNDSGIWKIKKENGLEVAEKLSYTSSHVFIDNDDICGKKCPEMLDKQYYIDMVNDRIEQILKPKDIEIDDTPQFLWICMQKSNGSYIEFLKLVSKKFKVTNKIIQKYIVANCCRIYGNNKKLIDFLEYFEYFYHKKTVSIANIQKKFDEKIINVVMEHSEINSSGKSLIIDNADIILNNIFNIINNDELPLKDILLTQANLFGKLLYVNPKLDDKLWVVQNYSITLKPTVIIYQLCSGKIQYCFVDEKIYKLLPITDGDIIKVENFETEYGKKISDKDDNGINILVDDTNILNTVIKDYIVVEKMIGKISEE